MEFNRSIRMQVTARDTLEGGGVIVARALPHAGVVPDAVDPFLLLDEARIDPQGPGFPEHPHRGFEIITYLLSGWASHEDNLGNRARVDAGGVMKLTAGSGIWHGEQAGASEADGRAHALQFWVNLPKLEKGRAPEFQSLQVSEIPEQGTEGSRTRILVGPGSPLRLVTPMIYLDVTVDPGMSWAWSLPLPWQGYAYVLKGGGEFGAGREVGKERSLLVLGEGEGVAVRNSSSIPLRFMLAAGQPHRQKIVWNGPFVD